MKYVCFVVSFGTAEHVPNNTVQFKISCLNSGPKIFIRFEFASFFQAKIFVGSLFCVCFSVCVCLRA